MFEHLHFDPLDNIKLGLDSRAAHQLARRARDRAYESYTAHGYPCRRYTIRRVPVSRRDGGADRATRDLYILMVDHQQTETRPGSSPVLTKEGSR